MFSDVSLTSMTTDGKRSVAGAFGLYETTGVPLADIMERMYRHGLVIDHEDFCRSAIRSGLSRRKIRSILIEANTDSLVSGNRPEYAHLLDQLLVQLFATKHEPKE